MGGREPRARKTWFACQAARSGVHGDPKISHGLGLRNRLNLGGWDSAGSHPCPLPMATMKSSPIQFPSLRSLVSVLACLGLLHGPAAAAPTLDPAAVAVLRSVQGKLAASPTLAVEAQRSTSWSDKGDGLVTVTIQRPNRFLARQGKGGTERVLAYDGAVLRYQLPGVLLHGESKLTAPNAPALADAMQKRLGFRPPLAELLAPDLVAEMAREGASIRLGQAQRVGWTKCQQVIVSQPGQTTTILVGEKDGLPRRYRISFDDVPGSPWIEARFKKWKFGVAVAPETFRPAPAAGSQAVPLLKSR